MEWAYELINGYKAGDARATNIVEHSRNLVVPIVNPDGFNGSRSAGGPATAAATRPSTTPSTSPARPASTGARTAARRHRDRALPDLGRPGRERRRPEPQLRPVLGRPGLRHRPATQTYRGPAPFSEPESRNVQWLVSHNQVTTLITNHTTAGARAARARPGGGRRPGRREPRLQALGDDMAKQNGYFSQKGFELYDTTGTTEDWSYNATGGFGFTFEIYCGAPNYATGDCDAPAFHPRYATMAKEWDGTSARPTTSATRGRPRLRRPGQPRGVLHRGREHDRRGPPLRHRGHARPRASRCG